MPAVTDPIPVELADLAAAMGGQDRRRYVVMIQAAFRAALDRIPQAQAGGIGAEWDDLSRLWDWHVDAVQDGHPAPAGPLRATLAARTPDPNPNRPDRWMVYAWHHAAALAIARTWPPPVPADTMRHFVAGLVSAVWHTVYLDATRNDRMPMMARMQADDAARDLVDALARIAGIPLERKP